LDGGNSNLTKYVNVCQRICPVDINYTYKTTFLVDTLPEGCYNKENPFDGAESYTEVITLEIEFENVLAQYTGFGVLDKLHDQCTADTTALPILQTFYLHGALDDINNPVSGYVEGVYRAILFPAKHNMRTATVRGRGCFTNTFWKDSRAARTTLGSTKFNNPGLYL
jgi:hypothetical protein